MAARIVPSRRPNAPRVPELIWERLKDEIIDLYRAQNIKAPDVAAILRQRHNDFTGNKRQLVHQLGKWRVKKYQSGGRAHPPRRRPPRPQASPSISSSHSSSPQPSPTPNHAAPISPRKEAADLCFAICDDEAALPLYAEELDAGEHMGIAAARSVHRGAGRGLCDRIRQCLDQDGCGDPQLKKMLRMYITHQTDSFPDQHSSHGFTAFMEGVVSNGASNLSHRGHEADLVTFHLLSDALTRYAGEGGAARNINTRDVLESFMRQSPRQMPAGPESSIRKCLSWCILTLKSRGPLPAQHQLNIPPNAQFWRWRENLLVSCRLWGLWKLSFNSAQASLWDTKANDELAIFPTEVLFNLCGLAMRMVRPHPSRQDPHHRHEQQQQPMAGDGDLMACALSGFEKLQALDDTRLWRKFLSRFRCMGTLVKKLNSAERDFKKSALEQVRSYAAEVLHIEPILDSPSTTSNT